MFEPTLVYKSPGSQYGPEGKTYSWAGIKTQEELDGKLADGWHLTMSEAITPKQTEIKVEVDPVPADNAPVTRVELEHKANELGLKFDGRTSDNKLLERIEEALKNGMD